MSETAVKIYQGGTDGGLAHVTYWGLPAADPDYHAALVPEEQAKVVASRASPFVFPRTGMEISS